MMTTPQWVNSVQAAFPDVDLRNRILQAAELDRQTLPSLFEEIAGIVLAQRQHHAAAATTQQIASNPKKRKLDDESINGAALTNGAAGGAVENLETTYHCGDVSFQVPARKKLRLEIVRDAHKPEHQEVRLIHPQTNQVEYGLPISHIDQVFCLPVPEKQQRQWNFVIFPSPTAVSADGAPREQIVFTMNETPPATAHSAAYTPTDQDTYITVTELELARMLQTQGKSVIIPKAEQFASSIPQAHRKGEKAYHVNAHRGSKEGYLFFLENGIVFGFKKPLAFFPFSAIESISYTSVLQRTFNLVIAAVDPSSVEATTAKEIEFSMLDQANFAGIDDYVKRHGLNDASMAATRRAKAYNVNKERRVAEPEGNGAAAPDGEEDGQTELQKAEQQLQDEEDEEEEDYEVSGGESDGEGEYSSGEDEDGQDEGDWPAEDDGGDDGVDDEHEG